ncbi:MAG: hypothetical protein QME94_16310 [Anaerolineae bacterium]|nr:hypothetical protein [Anaerolineae bacterium]
MNQQRVLYFDVCSRQAAVRPATTRVNTRLLALSAVFLLLVALGALLYLTQASTAAGMRYRLSGAERVQADLQEEISALRCQIAAAESMASLEARVEALGLVDASPNDPVMICQVPAAPAGPDDGAEGAPPRASGVGSVLHRLLSLLALKPRSPVGAAAP